MANTKIKCLKKKIEDGGATICLGADAYDSSGILIPNIVWEKTKKEKPLTDKINPNSDLDFNTVVYRGPFCKTIGEFMSDTQNFIEY
jgi:hypothetical protein